MKLTLFKNKEFKIILLVSLIFLFLGMLYTWPLILHMNSYLSINFAQKFSAGFHNNIYTIHPSDALNNIYRMWQTKYNLFHDFSFFSNKFELATNQGFIDGMLWWMFPLTLLFWILAIFDNIFAYNSLVLLSFLLAGLSMFLLVRFYTKNIFSAFLAGVIFTIAPSRQIHLLGHSNAFLYFLFPLLILFLELLIEKKKYIYAILAGLCYFSLILGEWHLFFYATLFFGFWFIFKLFKQILSTKNIKKILGYLKLFWPFFIFMVLSLTYIFYIYSHSFGETIAAKRSLWDVSYHSPKLRNIFENIVSVEGNVYLGISGFIILVLAISLLSSEIRKHFQKQYAYIVFLLIIFVFSYWLAFGTNSPFNFYEFLYKHIPFFKIIVVSGRIMILVFTLGSILTGYFFQLIFGEFELKRISKPIRNCLFGFIILLILTDFYIGPMGFIKVNQGQVAKLFDSQKINGKILYLPFAEGWNTIGSVYQFETIYTKTPMINAYTPLSPIEYENFYKKNNQIFNEGKFTPPSLNELKEYGTSYIIVYKNLYDFEIIGKAYNFESILNNLNHNPNLKLVNQNSEIYLYQIK